MSQPKTQRAAVLGTPIEHSRSPILHNAGYAAAGLPHWEYSRIECAAEDLPRIVREADESFRGFSVTMPAKFAALKFADEASERAREIGSANTLIRTENGWFADNTDVDGIIGALSELVGSRPIRRALVIGGGGTARPALWALRQAGVEEIDIINRTDRSEELRTLLGEVPFSISSFDADLAALSFAADVIISTVPPAAIEGHESALAHAPILDVIYDPWPTPLTTAAAANGYVTVGGDVMLAYQAFGQFELFTGVEPPREIMRQALKDSLR
ncbi:Shikimate dehydrogenase [Corynebacterium atrinae]|uniref:shikimate dehydrogenase n=1 Tax=Corynebacterium atrinae TaxID=1336740 RepID=UPI0025B2A433|nr:shikimate dehydrogenase [Corynebacterium atrinae]WJY63501.1 Shikimate dehydrogenase [Corynebacterium atrinae]